MKVINKNDTKIKNYIDDTVYIQFVIGGAIILLISYYF